MPTISYPLALIQLWITDPELPWSNPVWQSVTHVHSEPWAYEHGRDVTAAASHHDVTGWTVGKAQAVETFVNNCKMAEDPAEHYAIRRQDNDHEGRCLWNTWVKTSWAKWNINKLVDDIFEDSGCAPHSVMARLNCRTADDFPTMEAAQVKQIISIKLADVLFGDDAFTDGSFLVPPIMTFVSTVLVSTWSRYRKVIKRQANSIDKKTKDVEEQWLVITTANAKLTTASIRTYLKKLETLVTLLSVFKDKETAKNLDARREQVNAMLAAVKKDPTNAELISRLPKSLRDALDKLATEQEVKELELLIETTLSSMVPLDGDEVSVDFTEDMDVSDWKSGVEEYDKCSQDDLWEHLGLSEKRLPFFHTRCDPDAAIDPWSEEGQQWLDDPTSPAQSLAPRWHQLVGILRLIDRFLDGKPVMLMDGVGVGKTMQAVGLIACLAHYREHHRMHGKFPGKFSQRCHRKTNGNIPDLPVVILSPPNLQHQWMSEIQRYLRRATFDVLPYAGKYSARSQWWTMAWSKCQQPPIRRIILATTNAAHDDAVTVFIEGDRNSYGQPMAGPRLERTAPSTLFGRGYNVTFFDEAHCARKYNKVHTAARGLQERSHLMVAMTATPVTTKPTDLWIMGQLLGLSQFKDTVQLKNMNRELAAAQRRDRKAQREAGVEGSMLRGVLVGSHNPEAAQEEYLPAMKQWMGRMREWFSPAVILRTLDSTDSTGNKILGLPPYHDHSLKITLLDWEMENLRNIARGYINDCPIVGLSKNFYVEFRRSILHPHMNPTEEQSWTKPKSLEEWDVSSTKSTKLDVLAKLLKYHLESDGRQPLMMDESGRNLVPNLALKAGNTSPDEPDRIIVFSAFVTSNQAIVDILDLHGIHALELNGQTPMRKRKDILDDFRSSARTKARVLILSGWWWDTLWSEQDDRQLRGRIYRHPQAKEVHVYRAIALKTADVFLNNISFSKGAMHEAFVGADKEFRCMFDDDSAMGDLISVPVSKLDDFTDDSDPMDVDHEPIRRNKASKKKARPKATAKIPLSPVRTATKRKLKGTKAKSASVGVDDESGGGSHKRRKDDQPPPITSKDAAGTTSKVTVLPRSQGGNADSSISNPPLLTPPPTFPCLNPSLPRPTGLSALAPAPTAAPVSTPNVQSDQPAGLQDDRRRTVAGVELSGHGHEQGWNDGGDHESRLTVVHDEQPPRVRPDLFDEIFNKKREPVVRNLGVSGAIPAPKKRFPHPRAQAGSYRPPGQTFNPVPLGSGSAHSAKFSSNEHHTMPQRSPK
ncbi:P-loop containing nucleoside triphosphate hydrolase protein [Suillus placidus]|uniref:P-loop containing nucleoside triphosphate hydrolase protein n=1 Tax=Suillus placidus TaxID=48579 RepID=A0A9P7D5M6_9AGAM|nr:P-loop containing nucleoside triphosphate hydrolase protein [Suillus placidus]